MSHTKRHPVARPPVHPQITPRALELFTELEQARRSGEYDAWWELHSQIHAELRCRLWDWPCVARGPNDKVSDADAHALWERLDEARRAQRRALRINGAANVAARPQ